MEKEVTAEEIVFRGDQLVYGGIYTIRIRDAEVKFLLKGRFSDGNWHTLKTSVSATGQAGHAATHGNQNILSDAQPGFVHKRSCLSNLLSFLGGEINMLEDGDDVD